MKFSCSLQMTTRQVLLTCSVSLATRNCQWTQTRAPGRWWWWRTVQNRSRLRFWRRVLGHQGWDVVLAQTSVRTTEPEEHRNKPQCSWRMTPTEMMNSVTGTRTWWYISLHITLERNHQGQRKRQQQNYNTDNFSGKYDHIQIRSSQYEINHVGFC
jgi:hypothetical protein